MSVQQIQEQFALIDAQMPTNISKEGCYFMGNTGVGKSTLINYLLGQKMTFKYDSIMENFSIFTPQSSKKELPKIGNQSISETMIPKSYQSENGLLLYDTPGFLTTMGRIQEILDSYANYKIFVKGSKIKIILVIDEPTLKSSRGQFLVDAAERLQNMFPNQLNLLVNSICIIVTKVQKPTVHQSDIAARIKNIMTQQKLVNQEKVHLFDFVLKLVERNQVYCFYSPNLIFTETVSSMIHQIKKLKFFTLTKPPMINFSPNSKLLVNELAQKLKCKLKQMFSQKIVSYQQNEKNFDIFGIKKQISYFQSLNVLFANLKQNQDKDYSNLLTQMKMSLQEKQQALKIQEQLQFCQPFTQSSFFIQVLKDFFQKLALTIQKFKATLINLEKIEQARVRAQQKRKNQQARVVIQRRLKQEAQDRRIQEEQERRDLNEKLLVFRRQIQRQNQVRRELQQEYQRKKRAQQQIPWLSIAALLLRLL